MLTLTYLFEVQVVFSHIQSRAREVGKTRSCSLEETLIIQGYVEHETTSEILQRTKYAVFLQINTCFILCYTFEL